VDPPKFSGPFVPSLFESSAFLLEADLHLIEISNHVFYEFDGLGTSFSSPRAFSLSFQLLVRKETFSRPLF